MTKTCSASAVLAAVLLGCFQSAPGAGDDVAGMADDGRDASGDADGGVDAGRWVSTVVLDETTAYGSTVNVFLRVDPPANDTCGRVLEEFGDCMVETYTYPTCAPSCVGITECIWDDGCGTGRCYGHMDSVSAGEVAIIGATVQPDLRCFYADTGYFCSGGGYGGTWPDLWNEGDTIRVSAPGDVFPAFHFELVAPADMTLTTGTASWTTGTFDGTADVGLAWTPGSGRDQIHLQLQTGARDKLLTCDTSDDGSFAIPAAAIRSTLGGPTEWYVLIVDRIASSWWLSGSDPAVLGVAKSSLVVIIPNP